MAIGEELDGVDIGLVAGKCLNRLSGTDIPELSESIAGSRNEGVGVRGIKADAHHVSEMVGEVNNLLAGFNIPLNTSHVTRGGNDASVVDKSTAREVASMARELPRHSGRTVALLVQVVDGADVVEATTGNIVSTGRVGTGHDPGRS